jgi:hypothetical protein
MKRDLVLDGLRFKLAQKYRENPTRFLSLSREIIDSSSSREIVAELRNEGHVEEDVRGTIRFTARGYRAFQNDPPPYSYSDWRTAERFAAQFASQPASDRTSILGADLADFRTQIRIGARWTACFLIIFRFQRPV